MKKGIRATALIKSTPQGYSIWLPRDQLEQADEQPEEPSTIPTTNTPQGG